MIRANNNYKKRLWRLWLVGLLASMASPIIVAQTAVQKPDLEPFSFELSNEAQEAVKNGVTLSFDCQLAIRQSYWLFTTETQRKRHVFMLVRQALSNRYIVKQDKLDTPHLFRTISQATSYIAEHALNLFEFYNSDEQPYSMRLSLNKYKLPGPMRLNAFISDDWELDTGWIAWQSER